MFGWPLTVSVSKKTPPEKRTFGKISLENTKPRAGEESPLLLCRAKACLKRSVVVHGHRYERRESLLGIMIYNTTYNDI